MCFCLYSSVNLPFRVMVDTFDTLFIPPYINKPMLKIQVSCRFLGDLGCHRRVFSAMFWTLCCIIFKHNWLVVWNHGFLWLSIQLGIIIIPTDFHNFQKGLVYHQPDNSTKVLQVVDWLDRNSSRVSLCNLWSSSRQLVMCVNPAFGWLAKHGFCCFYRAQDVHTFLSVSLWLQNIFVKLEHRILSMMFLLQSWINKWIAQVAIITNVAIIIIIKW